MKKQKEPQKRTSVFQAAEEINRIVGPFGWADTQVILRWVAERNGWSYPIKIQGGASFP